MNNKMDKLYLCSHQKITNCWMNLFIILSVHRRVKSVKNTENIHERVGTLEIIRIYCTTVKYLHKNEITEASCPVLNVVLCRVI